TLDSGTFQGDNSPAKLLTVVNDELSKQMTFETRITSPKLSGLFGLGELLAVTLGSTDFTAGVFYQRRKLDPVDFVVDIYSFTLGELILLNNNPAQSAVLELLVPNIPPAAEADYFETHKLVYRETSDAVAGFGQMNWHFTDRSTLVYGMRLNFDRKSAFWDATNIGPTGGPESAIVIGTQISPFTAKETRSEFQFAPKVGLKYDWTDDVGFFATWSRSFRSGGFNTANAESAGNTRIFDSETSTSWELGAKLGLLDDTATVNVGLFHMTVTDFQYYTNDPTQILPAPFVANAGKLRARGVETDLTVLATSWLTLRGALGFDDTEFIEFPTGACTLDRPNTDGDGDRRCDLSGGPLEQAPKWNITLTPIVALPLGRIPLVESSLPLSVAGVDLTGSVTAQYQDTQFLDLTLDPRNRQDPFFRFGGNVGFADAGRGWSVGIHVVNATDEATAAIGGEGITQCSGCFTRLAEPPRLIFGRFRWLF
ncbi:MAG: TonB-dependent receptor, partial [Candidatus Binatia bacterium]